MFTLLWFVWKNKSSLRCCANGEEALIALHPPLPPEFESCYYPPEQNRFFKTTEIVPKVGKKVPRVSSRSGWSERCCADFRVFKVIIKKSGLFGRSHWHVFEPRSVYFAAERHHNGERKKHQQLYKNKKNRQMTICRKV